MKKLFFLFLLGTCTSLSLWAESVPQGYYDAIIGLQDSVLKGTLKSIIRPHTAIPYGTGTGHTWEVFFYSDRDTVTGEIMDMYCDDWEVVSTPGQVAAGCNIEHSFAKSWWGGVENDAYKDCYHLNPSNSTANSARSNYPLGEVGEGEFKKTSGSLTIGQRYHEALGENFCFFEPKDEYKGDFARAYFYMATCYGRAVDGSRPDLGTCSKKNYVGWRIDNVNVGARYAMQNDNYLEFQDWEIATLLKWHRQDPVSPKEIRRADAVSDFQHNHNPYIDHPELAEYIWGNLKGQAYAFPVTELPSDQSAPCAKKLVENGRIYILLGDHAYTLTGQRIR